MYDQEVIVNPPLLDAPQACRYLGGISRRTLTNLVQRGELKTVAVFRRRFFRRADLDRLVKVGTTRGKEAEK
jgi:excisionase family DNA binding protein